MSYNCELCLKSGKKAILFVCCHLQSIVGVNCCTVTSQATLLLMVTSQSSADEWNSCVKGFGVWLWHTVIAVPLWLPPAWGVSQLERQSAVGLGCRLKCCYFDSILSSRVFLLLFFVVVFNGGGGGGDCSWLLWFSNSQLLCIYVFIVWFFSIIFF